MGGLAVCEEVPVGRAACPVCKKTFQWNEIDTYKEDGRRRTHPDSFACPRCLQTIGVPNWRTSFLLILYVALIGAFLFALFDLPGELSWGFVAVLVASTRAIRIADWFIVESWSQVVQANFTDLRSLKS